MPDVNNPPCHLHGAPPRAHHPHNFNGIVTVIGNIIDTISGVGTTSFTKCSYGYPPNFEGIVRALEDLNFTCSGIQGGGGGGGGSASGVVGGSGIYVTLSGASFIINSAALPVYPGSGVTPESSGTGVTAGTVFHVITSGQGGVDTGYDGTINVISGGPNGGGGAVSSGNQVIVSGHPGDNYTTGDLWFDTNQGRLFVYASGGDVSNPDWYQTNAEALALMSDAPPSGTGLNAPPRDGSIWFNTLMGSLFIYEAQTSGWYESGPTLTPGYGNAERVAIVEGSNFIDTSDQYFKYWDGTQWIALDGV